MRSAIPNTRTTRIIDFVQEVHPVKLYLVFSFLWSVSLIAVLSGLAGVWAISGREIIVAATLFLILLFLRAVDEIKDLDYDRVYKADRPLVRGAITSGEVWLLAGLAALTVVALNLLLSGWLALFTIANMAYGLWLLVFERISKTMRSSVILNLLVTFPVSAALNVYIYFYVCSAGACPSVAQTIPIVAAYICAALHFEFGRKLKWPHHAKPGDNSYTMVLGVAGAVTVCLLLGLSACTLIAWSFWRITAPSPLAWVALLPFVALTPGFLGLYRFFQSRQTRRDLKPYYALSLLSFYICNLAVTLLTRGVTIGG